MQSKHEPRICLNRLGHGLVVAHIPTGEVTALQHEPWDHSMEDRPLVAEVFAHLTGAQSPEVLGSLRYDVVEKLEIDAALLLYRESILVIRKGDKEGSCKGQAYSSSWNYRSYELACRWCLHRPLGLPIRHQSRS